MSNKQYHLETAEFKIYLLAISPSRSISNNRSPTKAFMESIADPSSTFTIFYAAAAVAVLWYATLFWRWSRPKSAPLPGPSGLPLVGNLPFLEPELHTYFARLARTYGPIFRLKLGVKLGVVISSAALAREVLRDQDPTFANRDVPAVARIAAYGGSDILWSPNGPTWRMLRRVCVREMLSPTILDAVYGLRRREVRATVSRLREAAGQPVDVGSEMFLTAVNVMTSILWGGSLVGEERDALGDEFREVVDSIAEMQGRPNVSDFFPSLARFDLQGLQGQTAELRVRFDRIFDAVIEQRRKMGDRGGNDLLKYMLKLEAEEGGNPTTPFTMTHIKALLMDLVVGGTDTTSTTLEWAMAEMMQKPEIIRRVQEEIEQVVGKNNIVEECHISELHYLQLVIKEVLRLHPTIPLLVPHCPSSSCIVSGYTIPKGCRVFINVWAIHRDPSIWEDPVEFKPQRFLSMAGRWDFSGSNFNYFPFGSGRRICIGIPLAERMITYSLASLLHSFDWKLPEGEKHDLTEKFGIVLKKAKPLVAIPTPRLSNPNLYS